jgi:hypothetical protein
MNSRIFLMAVAVIAAFGIAAAVVGPVTIPTPVLAQMPGENVTGANVTGANVTGANVTAGNVTG